MLRAAYFAQELLSTFNTAIGEVALQPSTGGVFVVALYVAGEVTEESGEVEVKKHVLWDRKAEGGFPETKILKRLVRDVIEPDRDLGHVDGKKAIKSPEISPEYSSSNPTPSTSSTSNPPIPKAISLLQPTSERKFTPMDIDTSRPGSSLEKEREVVNSRGKIVISGGEEGGDGFGGFCRPGDEDCG